MEESYPRQELTDRLRRAHGLRPESEESPEVIVRPKRYSYKKADRPFRAAIEEAMRQLDEEGTEGASLTRAAMQLIKRAADGDTNSIKELADRMDGKPTQAVDMDVRLTLEQLITQCIAYEEKKNESD